jgi:hypothetical protein
VVLWTLGAEQSVGEQQSVAPTQIPMTMHSLSPFEH